METFFKKYFWTFTLVMLIILGLLAGVTTANFVAASLTLPPAKIMVNKPSQILQKAKNKGAFILGRNMFNSEALVEPEVEEIGFGDFDLGNEEDPFDGEIAEASLNVTLRITLVSEHPDWSVAVLEEGQETYVVRIGSHIDPDATVYQIDRERILVSRGNRIESISFREDGDGPKPGAPSRTSSRPSARTARPSPPGAAAIASGIKKTGDTDFQIDRNMLEEQLQDLNRLGTQARIVPHYQDGKASGFKLVGVRPGSLYSHVGIRSGDVIQMINGEAIDSPNKALELYQRLRTSDSITVDLERGGQRHSLNYSIK